MSFLDVAPVDGLVGCRRVATLVATERGGCLSWNIAQRGGCLKLARELALQRINLTLQIDDVLVVRSVDDFGLLGQHIGCVGSGGFNGAGAVGGRKGVGESRRKGQSECGVGVHGAR